jgi:hypothetical protein
MPCVHLESNVKAFLQLAVSRFIAGLVAALHVKSVVAVLSCVGLHDWRVVVETTSVVVWLQPGSIEC